MCVKSAQGSCTKSSENALTMFRLILFLTMEWMSWHDPGLRSSQGAALEGMEWSTGFIWPAPFVLPISELSSQTESGHTWQTRHINCISNWIITAHSLYLQKVLMWYLLTWQEQGRVRTFNLKRWDWSCYKCSCANPFSSKIMRSSLRWWLSEADMKTWQQ